MMTFRTLTLPDCSPVTPEPEPRKILLCGKPLFYCGLEGPGNLRSEFLTQELYPRNICPEKYALVLQPKNELNFRIEPGNFSRGILSPGTFAKTSDAKFQNFAPRISSQVFLKGNAIKTHKLSVERLGTLSSIKLQALEFFLRRFKPSLMLVQSWVNL